MTKAAARRTRDFEFLSGNTNLKLTTSLSLSGRDPRPVQMRRRHTGTAQCRPGPGAAAHGRPDHWHDALSGAQAGSYWHLSPDLPVA
jgi:hypothetical protein